MSNLRIAVLAIGVFFSAMGEGHSLNWKWYQGDKILFSYPSSMYGVLKNETESINRMPQTFEMIDMNKPDGNTVDSITSCIGKLADCASRKDFDKPYWLEEASGRLIITNPTEKYFSFKNGFGSGYEEFPLCGWVDKSGVFSQYGGQYYVTVISDGKKTMSFSFVIGPNVGAKRPNERYLKQLKIYRKIINSAK